MRLLAPALCLTVLLAACRSDPVVDRAIDTSPPPTTETSTAESSPSPTTPRDTSAPAAPPDPQPTPEAPGQVTVTIADFAYAPDPIQVAVGGSVTWTNEDTTAHTATVSGGGPNTGAISRGASATLVFDRAGTYTYVCQFHPGSMTGTVTVG